jgi:hypothetical protein
MESKNLAYYAHVKNGVVENVSIWDGVQPYDPGEDFILIPIPYTIDEEGEVRHVAGIGWHYVDGEFIDNRLSENEETG